jgi:hypothetical protein
MYASTSAKDKKRETYPRGGKSGENILKQPPSLLITLSSLIKKVLNDYAC